MRLLEEDEDEENEVAKGQLRLYKKQSRHEIHFNLPLREIW